MHAVASLIDTLLLHLAWTSIQATLLIGLLWLLGHALPRLPAPTRCLLWWLLGAQLLLGLAWQSPVSLPVLPAHVAVSVAQAPQSIHVIAQSAAVPTLTATFTRSGPFRMIDSLSWREALAALWLSGLMVQLILVARQWRRTRCIRRQSEPLDDPRLHALCVVQAQRLGLRRCPQLRICDAIDSPQVTGLWRPVILLPARTMLTSLEQAMALAHELAHVRRGDLWLGWIPALAKGLFFFHPLVRLAVREYALHREAACDSQALRLQPTAPHAYGQLLLRLGIERPAPVGLAGVASPSLRELKRRLVLLQHATSAMPRFRDWVVVAVVALACVMPYRIVAAKPDARPDGNSATSDSVTHAKQAQPITTTPADSRNGTASAVPCKGPGADQTTFCGANFLLYARPLQQGQGVVLFDQRRVIIHGTPADVIASHRLYKPGASVLWFRRGDKEWVTQNSDAIQRARQIYAPVLKQIQRNDLFTDEANALTDKQWALTSRLAGLSQKLATLGQQRAVLAQALAALVRQQVALQSATRGAMVETPTTAMGAKRKAIATRQHALDAQRAALDVRHTQLARQGVALDAEVQVKRQALATQRAELTTQRNALMQRRKQDTEHARQAMRQLLDDVLARGLARRVMPDRQHR